MTDMIDQIRADREAGTPGPWRQDADHDICHDKDGDGVLWTIAYPRWPDINDRHITWEQCHADARRIARVPDLESAYLASAVRIDETETALVRLLLAYAQCNGTDNPAFTEARATLAKWQNE
jgi:hypothetical protein